MVACVWGVASGMALTRRSIKVTEHEDGTVVEDNV